MFKKAAVALYEFIQLINIIPRDTNDHWEKRNAIGDAEDIELVGAVLSEYTAAGKGLGLAVGGDADFAFIYGVILCFAYCRLEAFDGDRYALLRRVEDAAAEQDEQLSASGYASLRPKACLENHVGTDKRKIRPHDGCRRKAMPGIRCKSVTVTLL